MNVRFLADENIDPDLVQGLQAREPAIDILDVKSAGLRGIKDPTLLELASDQDRIVVTHDRSTMSRYFYQRVATGKSEPGLFIVPTHPSAVGQIIESLLLVWSASRAEEWRNQIVYLLPLNGRVKVRSASRGLRGALLRAQMDEARVTLKGRHVPLSRRK